MVNDQAQCYHSPFKKSEDSTEIPKQQETLKLQQYMKRFYTDIHKSNKDINAAIYVDHFFTVQCISNLLVRK